MHKRVCLGVLIIILLGVNWMTVRAQELEFKFFDETGHNVKGEFLKFYNSNLDSALIYGYPITEEITSKDGKTVQYFQRARLELHADLPEGQKVQLTPLGRETYSSTSPLNVYNPFACRIYTETGFPVCFAFLEFYDKYGGPGQFGYPISYFEYHDNIIVQYFEKARLEWHPWQPEGQRVVISDLGRIYFDKLSEDPGYLTAAKPLDNSIMTVTTMQVRAFVWKAVTLANDSQLIFIIVQDQSLQPVSNASCVTTVHWPDDRSDSNTILTNTNGVGMVALSYTNQPYGSLIYTDVSCSYNDLFGITTTSFRIWY